jgi:lysophospholipase L1-like esterase
MRFLQTLAVAFGVAFASLALVDLVFDRTFPHFARLAEDFSAAYLRREVAHAARSSIVYLGDSALWGYGLPANEAAVTLLHGRHVDAENLSYEGGSPANTYAVLRLLFASGARPKAVAFNVNLKEFNAEDGAYRKLEPSVEELAWPLLSARQRAALTRTSACAGLECAVDAGVASVWTLYAMRADLRYALFGDVDAAHALEAWLERTSGAAARAAALQRHEPGRFEGTYDLAPLDPANVSVAYLRDTIALLRERHVRAFAILTPTNHALLHAYIDVPEYDRNLAYVRGMLEAGGVRVIDYDRRFAAADFIDNDHLTAEGNRRLADALERDVHP